MSVDYIEDVVIHLLTRLLSENSIEVNEITTDQTLFSDLGLESIDLAELLVNLEIELGIEPFSDDGVVIVNARTVGDLCNIYRNIYKDKETL